MATSLKAAVALLISAVVPATAIQFGGVLMRDPAEPVGSGAKDSALTDDEYRKVYEFDRDLVKAFDSMDGQADIDEVNVWASDDDEPKESKAEPEVQVNSSDPVDDAEEYLRRKQDLDALLSDDEWEEKKKEKQQESAPGDAEQKTEKQQESAPEDAEQEKQQESAPEDAEQKTEKQQESAPEDAEQKTEQQESAPEDAEQKTVERLVDIAAESEGEALGVVQTSAPPPGGVPQEDGSADEAAFAPETTEEYIEDLPGDEERLEPFPSLDGDTDQEDELDTHPLAADDQQQKQVPAENAVATEGVDKRLPKEAASSTEANEPAENREEAASSTEANEPAENREEAASNTEANEPVEYREEAASSTEANEPAENREEAASSTEANEPAENREEAASSTEANEPAENREEAASSTEANEPAENREEAASSTEANEPVEYREDAPTSTEANEPAENREDAPTSTEANEPTENREDAPTSTEANGPAENREDAPTSTEANEPAENREEAAASTEANKTAEGKEEAAASTEANKTAEGKEDEIIEDGVVRPKEPGCYVRTPKGCPNHPSFNSTAWKHEEYGEKHGEAKVDRDTCVVTRKAHVAHWCGSDEVHMLFVTKEGSFLSKEDGSRGNQPPAPVPAPNASGAAAEPATKAAVEAKPAVDVKATVDARHRLDLPTEPGCYVRTPKGCPAHPNYASTAWKHEEYGEKHKGAMTQRTTCEVNRKASVSRFCGTEEVETVFVPPPEPGCYFRLPSGCPKHPTFGGKNWKHEEFGEIYKKAREDRVSCEGARKEHIQHWCGTQDVLMRFIPPAPESLVVADAGASHSKTPMEPGCWVRTPKGCPRQTGFASADWRHDEFAEKYTFAKTNRTACEQRRKEHVVKLCGIPEVEMLFVPDAANKAAEEQRSRSPSPPTPSGGVPAEANQPAAAARIARSNSSDAAGSLQVPTEPGCYVRTPKGCPNHPSFSTNSWQHEQAGERNFKAKEDRLTCEQIRKASVAHWCGAEGVEMLFVPAAASPAATQTSQESGGAQSEGVAKVPTSKEEGQKVGGEVEQSRQASVGTEVQTEDVESHSVGGEQMEMVGRVAKLMVGLKIPSEPGCFVRAPSGCPKKPNFASNQWMHDLHAEKYTVARINKTACEVRRKLELNKFCGTQDIETMLVETQGPLYPTEPGCYYRTPAGCPGHPHFASAGYKHEEYSERTMGAKADRSACEVARRGSVARWCGTDSIEMLFVGEHEPGCYMRLPWGCPNHLGFGGITWKHDVHGEAHSGARLDRGACESYRGDTIRHWCGTDEVEMMFVPAPNA